MKKAVFFFALVLAGVATAASSASSGAHAENQIPFTQIGWQAANLGILLTVMFIYIRKSIIETFKNRQKNYLEQAEKTKNALKNAETALAGMKAQLADLESGEKSSIEKAKKDAAELGASLLKDAEAGAAKIKADATLTIKNELAKAKAEINNVILVRAIDTAKKSMTDGEQRNSKTQEASFIGQLEQVRP